MIYDVEKYLFSLETKGIKLGLSRTKELLKECGSPHKNIPIIQVLGTNGKGSTSAILYKLLSLEHKVGLYTSPHLYSFCERIRYSGRSISLSEVQEYLNKYQSIIENINASFFEVMTVMAIWYFSKKNADYAILETGLGGQFDSVTACEAGLFAITSISIDHSHILGDSLESITKEKIAAVHPFSKVYSVMQSSNLNRLIKEHCKRNQSNLTFVDTNHKLKLSLKGAHQQENASLALKIANNLLTNQNSETIDRCLRSVSWYGRNQLLCRRPDIIFDVAHNEEGIKSFLEFLKTESEGKYLKKTLLFSIQKNKIIDNIAPELEKTFDKIVYSETNQKYSMDFQHIKKYFSSAEHIKSPIDALEKITNNAQKDELIAIVGTHYWGQSIKSFFNICFDNI